MQLENDTTRAMGFNPKNKIDFKIKAEESTQWTSK